jgi:hypothetical protein
METTEYKNFKFWDYTYFSKDLSNKLKIFFNNHSSRYNSEIFHRELLEFIELLDKISDSDNLSRKELEELEPEIERCFSWYGKNYLKFWC